MTKCLCGGRVVDKNVTLRDIILGVPIRATGIPAKVCEKCGERYFSASVMERLEAHVQHVLAQENASRDQETRVISGRQLAKAL